MQEVPLSFKNVGDPCYTAFNCHKPKKELRKAIKAKESCTCKKEKIAEKYCVYEKGKKGNCICQKTKKQMLTPKTAKQELHLPNMRKNANAVKEEKRIACAEIVMLLFDTPPVAEKVFRFVKQNIVNLKITDPKNEGFLNWNVRANIQC